MSDSPETIRLTEISPEESSAAKIAAGPLREMLSTLQPARPAELSVGVDTLDDAALWDLGDGRMMIQSLDFFTPPVDDPFDFGALAAAGALGDIYAMGGIPRTALTILAFPTETLPSTTLAALLRGATAKIEEAGACLAGGHSLRDATLKLGFSVTGFVNRETAWKNSGARVGDQLILTKPLGTGTISTALRKRTAQPNWVRAAIASMQQLNRTDDLFDGRRVHAATAISGFGLAAHARHLADASQVTLEITLGTLPALPGTMECLRNGVLNGAHQTNWDYVAPHVKYRRDHAEPVRWLTADPQTSGGLLLSVGEPDAGEVLRALRHRFPFAARIGQVVTRAKNFSVYFK